MTVFYYYFSAIKEINIQKFKGYTTQTTENSSMRYKAAQKISRGYYFILTYMDYNPQPPTTFAQFLPEQVEQIHVSLFQVPVASRVLLFSTPIPSSNSLSVIHNDNHATPYANITLLSFHTFHVPRHHRSSITAHITHGLYALCSRIRVRYVIHGLDYMVCVHGLIITWHDAKV